MPDAGKLVFSDGSGQIEFNTREKRLREGFALDFQQRRERMKASSRKHSIPLLPINTTEPVLDQVRKQLGSRTA
jgi:uncharacterized protein (DUF58 family)